MIAPTPPAPRTDDELVTAASKLLLSHNARRSTQDNLIRALAHFRICQRNALEQPHKDWTTRELDRARTVLAARVKEADAEMEKWKQ